MPLFIVLCLALSFIVQTEQPVQVLLIAPWLTYTGVGLAGLIMLGVLCKKLTDLMWFDFFASCVLIAWFSYWKPLYVAESPMFFFFPVYFVVITAFVWVFFVGQRNNIDDETFGYVQKFAEHSMTQPWLIMLYALGSLKLLEHFLQYPVAMTLLILRFALSGCLQRESKLK
ncbi:hypothetical protein [Crenothrix polyspora]|uniref:Uncharacterized protein n=1 Tax=Crenothrix polyspora TaxID=360316 RepID=A0A1R4H310_9GAMM|nr:hypothetical protein [Crenothrix polyspora]SJM90239.1 conserved membrane hypothetical protein [Crenothrix polyspora]